MCISTGDRECRYTHSCGPDYEETCTVETDYPCYTLDTTIVVDGTFHTAQLYHSYADAKATDFECALYECRTARNIPGYVKDLEQRTSVKCYYRPGNEKHVYIETGDWTRILTEFIILIIFTVIGGIFDLVIIVLILLGLMGCCCSLLGMAVDDYYGSLKCWK